MVKAVIFDFDGVISDTLPSFFGWMKHIHNLTMRIFPCKDIEEFKEIIEDPYQPMYTKLGFDWNSEKEFLYQEFDLYMNNRHNPSFPGIEEVIKDLSKRNINLAIASSNHSRKIHREIYRYEIGNHFNCIIGRDHVTPPDGEPRIKPFPDCITLALNLLNCSPLETVYFGDQPVDVEACRKVKNSWGEAIPVVGVTYGFAPKEKLLAANPDMYVDKPEDILKII